MESGDTDLAFLGWLEIAPEPHILLFRREKDYAEKYLQGVYR